MLRQGWAGRAIGFTLGGLAVLGQAPLHIWPLSLVCFALLYLRLSEARLEAHPMRAGFWTAFWFALGYFGMGVFWIGSAFIARGPEFIPVMPPMILALAALLAFFWGLAGLVFCRKTLAAPWAQLAFISLFTLAELLRGHIFGGLPWNLTGYIFPAGGRFSQGAVIWTIYGQSAFVFVISVLIASAYRHKRPLALGGLTLMSLIALFGFGQWRLSQAVITPQDDIRLRIVSVPFNQADKFDRDRSVAIVNEFISESLADPQGLKEVTHIIWPEGAVVGLAMDNQFLLDAMGQSLAFALDPLNSGEELPVWILNSLRLELRPNPKGGKPIEDYYNSSVAVTFDQLGTPSIAAYNDKSRLVPFGEFIPFGKWMESINVPVISTSLLSISAAKEKQLAQFPKLPLGSPQICYEIIFSGFTPQSQNGEKAQFILNQSNDAWFGKSWGPAQHANIARYRAIEEGLPLIRSASNGLSAIIDPYGRIMAEAKQDQTTHIDSTLPQPIHRVWSSHGIVFCVFLLNLLIALWCAAFGRTE